jgi:NTE family protein
LEKQEKYNYGICLSGGGALGYAHVGVLQALHEYGIAPEIISGSSMGAIIGTIYAAGYSAAEILEICKSDKMYEIHRLIKPSFSHKGFASHKTLRKLLHDVVPHNDFEQLKHKLHICVTNIGNATYKTVNSGNLHDYVVASASIPGIFEVNNIDIGIYVDGGVMNNLPAEAIRDKCRILIGVDVIPYYEGAKIKHTTDVIIASIRTMVHANSISGQKLCDHLILSPAIKKYHEFNFDKFEKIYRIGYDSALEYIKNNPDILKYTV